ncbi:hypothetical protein [Solicola gregarius]|uniref:DUF3558 domain-containing protein n=1 Tax=Solicola gregarius TaxID=2908642 RepID=A0AA46TM74_9ACTN|nr:hypothetical protein [Solicola gregarius]UYM07698.1 hypothetical protein L0C25_11695 [Solicola gregarius]
MSRARPPLLAACAALILVAACSGGDADESYDPDPTVAYQSGVETPKDRDEDAVDAALGRIDPCALIDPAGAGVKGFPKSSELDPDGPHVCEVESPDYDEVRAVLGIELAAEDRFTRDLLNLGGAKAYLESSPTNTTFCRVALPVSFTHAIEFTGSSGGVGADACGPAKRFAALAAERLDQPDTLEQVAGPDRAGACDILRRAVDLKNKREFRSGQDFLFGMDKCGVWEAPDQTDTTDLQFEPVAPESYLEIGYSTPPNDEFTKDYGTVRGRALNGYSSGGCVLAWNEWDAPTNVEGNLVARFKASAPSCKAAKRLVAQVTKVVDDTPSSTADPQRPVLYAPDESDIAAPGGCVDLAEFATADCEAFVDAEVPEAASDVVGAADREPGVSCSLAGDAVREQFGDSMSPITATHGTDAAGGPAYMCGFTEPTHGRQVWIDVSSDEMPYEPGSEIDGHDAHDLETASEGTRQLWIAIDGGYVYGEVRVTPDRSTGMYSDSPVNDKPLDKLDEAMTDIMAEQF